jgi:hypothetical protein
VLASASTVLHNRPQSHPDQLGNAGVRSAHLVIRGIAAGYL